MLEEKQDLIGRIQTLTEQMNSFRKEKVQLDSQMKNSSFQLQKLGQLNEEVRKLKEKLDRLQEENSELRNENALKDVAIALL